MKCHSCGRQYNDSLALDDFGVKLHNGDIRCWTCCEKLAEKSVGFYKFWLETKTESAHGREINARILNSVKSELEIAKRKNLQLRARAYES